MAQIDTAKVARAAPGRPLSAGAVRGETPPKFPRWPPYPPKAPLVLLVEFSKCS